MERVVGVLMSDALATDGVVTIKMGTTYTVLGDKGGVSFTDHFPQSMIANMKDTVKAAALVAGFVRTVSDSAASMPAVVARSVTFKGNTISFTTGTMPFRKTFTGTTELTAPQLLFVKVNPWELVDYKEIPNREQPAIEEVTYKCGSHTLKFSTR
jgi:hypothetical protein